MQFTLCMLCNEINVHASHVHVSTVYTCNEYNACVIAFQVLKLMCHKGRTTQKFCLCFS